MRSKKKSASSRHAVAVLIILCISVLIGLAYNGVMTLVERETHPRTYRELVETYAAEYEIPTSVVYAVIKCESDFDASAVSHAGAVGLMQLMPSTFEWLCTLTGDRYDPALLYDPETNIRYGTYMLSLVYTEYGNWETAYAAYNAGFGNVDKWLADPEYGSRDGTLHYIPFKETRNYVTRVSEARAVYERIYREPLPAN